MLNIDKVYICHHNKLTERKEKLNIFFIKNNIDVEWVESYSPFEIIDNYNTIVGVDDMIIDKNVIAVCYEQYEYFKNAVKEVSVTELSLYLKHKYCFEDQIRNNYKNVAIMEDDVMLDDDFVNYFNKNMLEFNELNTSIGVNVLVMGKSYNFTSKIMQPNRMIHYNKNQLTRCTHCIIYNIESTKKIVKHLYPINWPIDFKLNEIMIIEELKVAWSEPGILQDNNTTAIFSDKNKFI